MLNHDGARRHPDFYCRIYSRTFYIEYYEILSLIVIVVVTASQHIYVRIYGSRIWDPAAGAIVIQHGGRRLQLGRNGVVMANR